MKSILLISPPVSKPCEPPAGLAKLANALRIRGIDCRIFDASIHGLLGVLDRPLAADDTWSRRALAGREANIDALRTIDIYRGVVPFIAIESCICRVCHTRPPSPSPTMVHLSYRRFAAPT